MSDDDLPFTDAVARAYLAAYPEHADWLASFAPLDREQYLRRWLGTFQAHRLMVAADLEAAGLGALAAWLRAHPLGR